LWLHFGVHGGAKTFLLEQRAYNDATFRCPDERGYMVCVNNDISWWPSSQGVAFKSVRVTPPVLLPLAAAKSGENIPK
jgi:hypothetical protein